MKYENASECWRTIQKDRRRDLLKRVESFARNNTKPSIITFGTSGWRGETGTDFTFRNLRIVVYAIINILKTKDPDLRQYLGTNCFKEVQKRGIVVGHDNRFLTEEFSREVISILNAEKIRVYYGGETTTPEISASINMLDAACSINITPSHNPSNYLGIKFNPSDGGPAGEEITDEIEAEANRLMGEKYFCPGQGSCGDLRFQYIDTTSLYECFLLKSKTLDLTRIKRFIEEDDCFIAIDHIHGATRGRPERFLIGTAFSRSIAKKICFFRKEDDPLFGGIAPEPSEKNMESIMKALSKSNSRFNIGAIMDPDGDRIRLADGSMQIPMNYFGAMALHFLHAYKGISGVAVKSLGTSNLVNAIAEPLGISVIETRVGFKNFRPYMRAGAEKKAIVVFEESDGISGYNNTLEKDALFGLLLAVEMVATTGKNLGEYLGDLMRQYGSFYPDRSGIEVDRSLAGEPLKEVIQQIQTMFYSGDKIKVGNNILRIKEINKLDGIKIILEDNSWLMIRASGTEPKVRFYIEARHVDLKDDLFRCARELTLNTINNIG